MKTFQEFLDEAIAASLVKAAARQIVRKNMLRSAASLGNKPTKLSLGKILYHGTTKPASQAIDKSGWRTDVNITRQMGGQGVYVTPQKDAARLYATQRSIQRGEEPSIRTLRIPSNIYTRAKENRQQSGNWNFNKGGMRFNALQMSPQAANKFDITNTPRANVFRIGDSNKKELQQRVSTGLKRPQNIEVLKKEIKSALEKRKKLSDTQTPN